MSNKPEKIGTLMTIDNGYRKAEIQKVRFPNGETGDFLVTSHSESIPNWGVSVLPIYKGKVIIFDQFRFEKGHETTEIIKGFGMNGKTPEETALTELKEEVGGVCKNIISLGSIMLSSPSTSKMHCFCAEIEDFGEQALESTEIIGNIRLVSFEELQRMVLEGRFTDSECLACISLFQSALSLNKINIELEN